MTTIMAVLPHPDDESIAVGGTFARCAAEGVRTVLVMCTGGEAGEISDPTLATPESLGDVRARELAASVAALGIARTVALGYRDSGMAGTPENQHPDSFHQAALDEAVARLLEVIREERPQVIVCPNEQGDYGHPDHVKANRVAAAAFRAADGLVAKLYYTAFPRSLMARFAEVMREMGEPPFEERQLVDLEGRPVELGTPDELVTTAVASARTSTASARRSRPTRPSSARRAHSRAWTPSASGRSGRTSTSAWSRARAARPTASARWTCSPACSAHRVP